MCSVKDTDLLQRSLDCGRNLENLERTHSDTGRTCKLHPGRSQAWELSPGSCSWERRVLTTAHHCRSTVLMAIIERTTRVFKIYPWISKPVLWSYFGWVRKITCSNGPQVRLETGPLWWIFYHKRHHGLYRFMSLTWLNACLLNPSFLDRIDT